MLQIYKQDWFMIELYLQDICTNLIKYFNF